VTEARELYREQDAVQILQKFRFNTSGSLSCVALIVQVCKQMHLLGPCRSMVLSVRLSVSIPFIPSIIPEQKMMKLQFQWNYSPYCCVAIILQLCAQKYVGTFRVNSTIFWHVFQHDHLRI